VAFFNAGVRIYPGTELERMARRDGVLTQSAAEMLEPVFYIPPGLGLSWMLEAMRRAAVSHLNFIPGDALAVPMLQSLMNVAGWLGFRPPIWRYTTRIRRVRRAFGLYP
jgi:hypothetical protein